MNRLSAYLKKDGWILAALFLCVSLCLLLGQQNAASTDEEDRISRVLSAIEGAGDVEVAVYYEEARPCGAVVVAEGASDIAIQLRLASAVQTLLGIDLERIAIYQREDAR